MVPAVKLTLPQKWMLVVDGEVGPNTVEWPRDNNPSGYKDWYEVFDFSKHEQPERILEGYEEAQEELRAESRSVQDRIMLGDSQEAMRLLDAFAKGDVE